MRTHRAAARTAFAATTRSVLAALVVGLVAMAVSPTPALAAGGEGGIKELIFQGINLVIVLGIIFYFARKPVLEYFATRRSDIKRDLDTAGELLAAAETRNSEIQRKLVDLESQIVEIQEMSRRRADDESERILAEARKHAERVRSDAHAAAEQELQRARRILRIEAAGLAADLASQLLSENVGESDRDRLVDEFITRVESAPASTA